jgi:plastocyanin domain-containing protein
MSIYQKPEVLESYPAYDVITFAPAENGNINLKAQDMLINNFHSYKMSSVASNALENGECPIKAYNRTVEKKQETHYIIAVGACLTSHKRAKGTRVRVEVGQKVNFEGRVYEITKQNNNNLGLKEII